MADQKISAATQVTTATAGTLFAASQSTTDYSVPFSMVGLEVASVITTDATVTGSVGQLTRWDISSLTGGQIWALPSTAKVGELCGLYIDTGSTTLGEEIGIRTTSASNDTINGTDYDSADFTRLFQTGECMVFMCVTADTDWIVVHDGRIPCVAAYGNSAYTFTADAAWTAINWGTTPDIDVGNTFDAAGDSNNGHWTARRAGKWQVTGTVGISSFATNESIGCGIYINQVAMSPNVETIWRAGSTGWLHAVIVTVIDVSVGSDVAVWYYQSDTTSESGQAAFYMLEVL